MIKVAEGVDPASAGDSPVIILLALAVAVILAIVLSAGSKEEDAKARLRIKEMSQEELFGKERSILTALDHGNLRVNELAGEISENTRVAKLIIERLLRFDDVEVTIGSSGRPRGG